MVHPHAPTLGLAIVTCCALVCCVSARPLAAAGVDDPTTGVNPPMLPAASDGSPDLSGGALRVIEVPAAANQPRLAVTPRGLLALSQRFMDGKALSGGETALYRAVDGVHWSRVPLEGQNNSLVAKGLTYGAGRFVVVGFRLSQSGTVILTSQDLTHWEEVAVELDASQRWGEVVFAGGRFFAFGALQLGVSEDGRSWRQVPTTIVQPFGLVFGNGRYVLVGSGGIQSSADGLSWEPSAVDCEVPEVCVTAPDGTQAPILFDVSFDGARFRAGPLESSDGRTWRVAMGRPLGELVGGYYFRAESATTLEASTLDAGPWPVAAVRPTPASVTLAGRADTSIGLLDRDAPLPDEIAVTFEDGLSCADAACIVINQRLYLVPPPGTAPLPDRVPRDAEGEALLTDECPVSTMLSCDDYAARQGCVCDPDAPREPRSCEDVGQFACVGEFEPRPLEWDVVEVGPAGCNCDHRDPDAPASFGLLCERDSSRCKAPLACLQVRSLETSCCGPPSPPPHICTTTCRTDEDCPSWVGTGFCKGPVVLRCQDGVCQQRRCDVSP